LEFVLAVPSVEWQRSFGGSDGDEARCIQQTNDGGYIVGGGSRSNNGDITGNHGGYDFWVIKLDSMGIIEWQKAMGGSAYDEARYIQQTHDDGYIVAGYSHSNDRDVTVNHGSGDFWVVKLDLIGNIEWQKSLGGSSDDDIWWVEQTLDRGFILTGFSQSNDGDVTGHHGSTSNKDYWIVKLDSLGNIQWEKSLGGNRNDWAHSIQQTSDRGYIVAGYTYSNDGDIISHIGSTDYADYWIVKLDSIADIQWQKVLGGSRNDFGYSIRQTLDQGYIVLGKSNSNDYDVSGNNGNEDYWVVKLNANGSIKWQNCLGGSTSEEGSSIQETSDGGYILAGYSRSNDGDVSGHHGPTGYPYGDYWIVKLKSNGDIGWQKSLGGTNDDSANYIQLTSDGGYILAGYYYSNNGDVTSNHGSYDYWIVKLSPDNIFILSLIPGWNLISIPLTLPVDASIYFPFLPAEVYQYSPSERRYFTSDSLYPGKGYWILSLVDTSITITGLPLHSHRNTILPGWNMVGSLFEPCSTLTYTSNPSIFPPLYSYNLGRYIPAYTLIPGFGYWVLATDSVEVYMESGEH